MVIYCTMVRNHGATGTFKDVTEDLQRIKELGADVLWLLPIHPIGKKNRKGTLGSPYSILDYNKINPEYGTLEDFTALLNAAHSKGLKVMMDVVFRHTSWDSVLIETHPEWYKQKSGKPVSSNPHWTDIIDLNWENPASGLWEYLCQSLCYWVSLGVDGFRCDVGNVVPIEFWKEARAEVSKVNPNTIWLCESWTPKGLEGMQARGEYYTCDSDLYQAFDITYDYDLWPLFLKVLTEEIKNPTLYLNYLRFQSTIYPINSSKLRFVENHDKPRAFNSCKHNLDRLTVWTAFTVFNKGPFLIFSGQENAAGQKPSLFDRDPIPWGDRKLEPLFKTLFQIKKKLNGQFKVLSVGPVTAVWYDWDSGAGIFGVFDDSRSKQTKCSPIKDGNYVDLLSGGTIRVSQGSFKFQSSVVIFEFSEKSLQFKPLESPLF